MIYGKVKLSGKNINPTMALVGRRMSVECESELKASSRSLSYSGCPTRSEATTAAIDVGEEKTKLKHT